VKSFTIMHGQSNTLIHKEMVAVRVLLSGGPDQLPEFARMREVKDLAEKVKIPFASGYEHFVHSGDECEVDGFRMPVFEWCDRTRVAE